MKTDTLQSNVEYGFTWGTDGTRYYLQNPQNEFKIVPDEVLTGLRAHAADLKLEELLAQTREQDRRAARTLEELIEEDYLREGEDVRRLVPPKDISLVSRGGLAAVVFAVTGLVSYRIATTLPTFSVKFLSVDLLYQFSIILTSALIHEFGHYIAARPHVSPEFDITLKSGFIPTFVTRTNAGYILPKNRARWISLAGPVFGLASINVVGLLYLSLELPTWIGSAVLIGYWINLFPLIPLFHGDGYLIVTKTLDRPNLRPQGHLDLANRELTMASGYVILTHSFSVLVTAFIGYQLYRAGRIEVWLVFVAIVAGLFLWTRYSNRNEAGFDV